MALRDIGTKRVSCNRDSVPVESPFERGDLYLNLVERVEHTGNIFDAFNPTSVAGRTTEPADGKSRSSAVRLLVGIGSVGFSLIGASRFLFATETIPPYSTGAAPRIGVVRMDDDVAVACPMFAGRTESLLVGKRSMAKNNDWE
jgi:hypothetical protein